MHWLDPSVLPTVQGRVAHFTLNPHGDIDGVLLDDDRQIHVPPHLGARLAKLVAVGDAIEARYVKPRDAEVFAAVSVGNAAGKTLIDPGPPKKHEQPAAPKAPVAKRPMQVGGRVRVTLYAPKGEVCGAVLEDGAQVRVDPKANVELAGFFAKDADIQVWGEGFRRQGVTVVDVHDIGYTKDQG